MLSLSSIRENKEKVLERMRGYERKLKALRRTLRWLEEMEREAERGRGYVVVSSPGLRLSDKQLGGDDEASEEDA